VIFTRDPLANEACVGELVLRARSLGYVESMSDPTGGFFSVNARTSLGGHPFTGSITQRKKRAIKESQVKFNVQCDPSGAVTVTAVGVDGPILGDSHMVAKLRHEFDQFAAGLH